VREKDRGREIDTKRGRGERGREEGGIEVYNVTQKCFGGSGGRGWGEMERDIRIMRKKGGEVEDELML